MKFLEFASLDRLNDFLSHLDMGERTIKGCLEAYTCEEKFVTPVRRFFFFCQNQSEDFILYIHFGWIGFNNFIWRWVLLGKHAGADKKLSHRLSLSLDSEIADYLGKSSDTDSSSSPDCISSRSSRKTLVYLVLTLYHMYPDYEFSAVKAHQYFAEESWDSFKQIFDTYMLEASKEWLETNGGVSLLDTLYKALDEVVKLSDCEIYSYEPDSEADPLLERGAIWSFNFFFYNRKLKRIVTFRFGCFSNLVTDGFLMDEAQYEEDGEIFADMDI